MVAAAESGIHRLVAVLGHGVVDDPDRPVLCADDLGLTRGDGCFDATRVVTDSEGTSVIDHFELHLDRFARAAAEGVSVSYELITIDDLARSDGAWLLSSGRLVAPILQLDDVQLAYEPAFTKRVWGWATAQR